MVCLPASRSQLSQSSYWHRCGWLNRPQQLLTQVWVPKMATAAVDTSLDDRPRGLQRTAVVGVLGGGQLGKMLGMEAVCTQPPN